MHNEALTCVALTRNEKCREVTTQGRVEGLQELGSLGCLCRQVGLDL